MSVLVIIPARGGSKGLPGKNLRPVAGVSLVGRAARVGREFLASRGATGTVLIDSDTPAIAEEACAWGAEAPFLRPADLAVDTTAMIDNVLHAVDRLDALARPHDIVVLLQPTSPLRSVDDVIRCFDALGPDTDSCVTVVPTDHTPEQTLRLDAHGGLRWAWPEACPDRRRQDFPAGYRPSGSVYVNTVDSLRANRAFIVPGRTRGVVIPPERSVDVDTAFDLALAEALARGAPRPPLPWRPRTRSARPFVCAECMVRPSASADRLASWLAAAADAGLDGVRIGWSADAPWGGSADRLALLARAIEVAHANGLVALADVSDAAEPRAFASAGIDGFTLDALDDPSLLRALDAAGRAVLLTTAGHRLPAIAAALPLAVTTRADWCLAHGPAPGEASPSGALAMLSSLAAFFRRSVGWSFRSSSPSTATAAAALGGALIERRLTACEREDPRTISAPPAELADLVRQVRAVSPVIEE